MVGIQTHWSLVAGSHLELLQHDGLVCKAQVAAAEPELLGELVKVDLVEGQ